jgi:hypothetical protein
MEGDGRSSLRPLPPLVMVNNIPPPPPTPPTPSFPVHRSSLPLSLAIKRVVEEKKAERRNLPGRLVREAAMREHPLAVQGAIRHRREAVPPSYELAGLSAAGPGAGGAHNNNNNNSGNATNDDGRPNQDRPAAGGGGPPDHGVGRGKAAEGSTEYWSSLERTNRRLVLLCDWIGFIDVVCAAIAVVDIETARKENGYAWENAVRCAILGLSFVSIFLICRLHSIHFYVEATTRGTDTSLAALLRSQRALTMAIEILIHLAQLPPFVHFDIVFHPFPSKGSASLTKKQDTVIKDSVINVFVLWRLYSMGRVAEAHSWLNKTSARFMRALGGIKTTFALWVKSVAHLHPFYLLAGIFAPLYFVIVYSYSTSERSTDTSAANFAGAFYVVAITMTSVGYGDVIPASHIGRFLCVVSAFVGAITMSLTVAFINERLILSETELCVVNVALRNEARNRHREAAVRVVISSLRALVWRKRHEWGGALVAMEARRRRRAVMVHLFEVLRDFRARKFELYHISESVVKGSLLGDVRDKVFGLNETVQEDIDRLERLVRASGRRLRALRAAIAEQSGRFDRTSAALAQAHAARGAGIEVGVLQGVEARLTETVQSVSNALRSVVDGTLASRMAQIDGGGGSTTASRKSDRKQKN